jgi:4-hydroxybenzoate polyprenyltransferase
LITPDHWLRRLFHYFLFTSFYIALCAAAMAFQTAYLFRLSHNHQFYGFVFCGTVCSYNLHWALTPKLSQNLIPASGLDRIPLRVHIVLIVAAGIGAVVLFVLLRPHWLSLAAAAALSFLYTAPKIPWRIMRFLQKIVYGKTVFLTLAWTYITTLLPMLMNDAALKTPHILFCVNRFYLIYAICILFDLRDRESDRQEGIKSMITQYHLTAVDRIYWGALATFFVTAFALLFYFSIAVVLALLIPGLFLLFGYGWFKKQRSDFVYNFVLDGLMVFSLPLLLLFGF